MEKRVSFRGLIDKDCLRRTSSKLPSSAATSLSSLAPRTSVELICSAILPSFVPLVLGLFYLG